ncbi:hypothetical protein L202_04416 [Cryptococcus amylolentus CBS 6039]|uniref:Deacetylase sirtuin-type domain-containing protein n=2 Tax=Cryptococcus amylolentus TaxID=104669 RepID=A0A1E3HTU8_9TREE|nr:hypothetical protein L202_04416 [Cryptococcus amylolentus CBS 6039]ODN78881.1 hypothetical protein L202_04416 [Cryptococcus amylolentus CBS 6039]ODO06644.1 hypothetical protein I350_04002 [Cryptococcus amylolentus CBS 6273]
MTIHVQLPSSEAGPSTPPSSFATPTTDAEDTLRQVVSRIRNSKKVVVVSVGAGVSTGAAIPDFRSASGLFNSKTKGGHSVQDLFHVRCLGSPALLERHHELITSLASLATSASPTPFHSYLSTIAAEDRLLRCYTQNIDGLEDKAGLSVGIPSGKRKSPKRASAPEAAEPEHKVIPLHGLLSSVHCTLCKISSPLADHLPLPPTPLPCPACALGESIRAALNERSRPSGLLRASVVLYGEDHPEGEAIGKVVAKDLKTVDCLVVCGTSLSVPGVKRVVKEMAKSAKSRGGAKGRGEIRTVFVNDEPPSKGAEWEGLFDVWVQSDVQTFVTSYLANPAYISTVTKGSPRKTSAKVSPKKTPAKKTPSTPKKTRETKDGLPPTPVSLAKEREVYVELPLRTTKSTPKKHSHTSSLPPTPTSLEKFSSHPSPSHGGYTTPTKKRPARAGPDTPETPGVDGDGEGMGMRPGKKVKREKRDWSPSPAPRGRESLSPC